MGWARSSYGKMRDAYRIWWGHFYKEATCKTWHGWVCTIRMDLPIGGYEL